MGATYISGKLYGIGSASDLQDQIDELKTSKQDVLINEVTLKSINGTSLLGQGSVDIEAVGTLRSDLIVTRAIGGIASGTVYVSGTSFETILRDMLAPDQDLVQFFVESEACISDEDSS